MGYRCDLPPGELRPNESDPTETTNQTSTVESPKWKSWLGFCRLTSSTSQRRSPSRAVPAPRAQRITGDPGKLTEGYYEISVALRNGQRILVLTRTEIEQLKTTSALSQLLIDKILDVTLKGTKVR